MGFKVKSNHLKPLRFRLLSNLLRTTLPHPRCRMAIWTRIRISINSLNTLATMSRSITVSTILSSQWMTLKLSIISLHLILYSTRVDITLIKVEAIITMTLTPPFKRLILTYIITIRRSTTITTTLCRTPSTMHKATIEGTTNHQHHSLILINQTLRIKFTIIRFFLLRVRITRICQIQILISRIIRTIISLVMIKGNRQWIRTN